MSNPGPYTRSAMGDLGIELDARGLLPLREARRRVREARAFVEGASHRIPGQLSRPTDADYLWAALLSLADAGEFVREASRIVWKTSPPGMDNIAPYERYGDAIIPWLARFIGPSGLTRTPWCVAPCLLEIGTRDALELVLRIRTVDDPKGREHARDWLRRHGARGWTVLADLASEGNAAAKELIEKEAKRAPASVKKVLARATGSKRAAALLERTPAALGEAAILEVLDDAACSESDAPMAWPSLHASVGHFELHAMRVIAVRSKKGDDWGVLFEVVQGDILAGPDNAPRWPATIQQYLYGSRVPPGGRYLEDARPISVRCVMPAKLPASTKSFAGIKVMGPKGSPPIVLSDAVVASLDLQPGRACASIDDWPSVLAIRARLARDPSAFWIDPTPLAKKLLGIADPVVVVASDRFEHVCGPACAKSARLRRRPSESPTYRSIAAAIVHRDPKRFVAGKPNTDWRSLVKS